MKNRIIDLAQQLEEQIILCRRDFHKYPEAGWTEFRTAAAVVKRLQQLGYEVLFGEDALVEESMMGVPSADVLRSHMQRAVIQGADQHVVEQMNGGKTAVVGILRMEQPGPVVGLRFDMDCNDVVESSSPDHYPNRAGFSSVNPGCMHACGHDCHTSVGLGIAEILATLRNQLAGTVKLIFQPAEEGVRGAKSIVDKGLVDDVDYMIGAHVMDNPVGYIAYNATNFLATTKFDVVFTGVSAHAGVAPEYGRNALLAAAVAAVNIHAIPRHSKGVSRINVGVLNAGTGRNVIAGTAVMRLETRGLTSEVDDFIIQSAYRIIAGAAQMYDVEFEIVKVGSAAGTSNSLDLSRHLRVIGDDLCMFDDVADQREINGSDDFSYYMERVQKNGGKAAYIVYGGNLAAVHHNSLFDIEESCMVKAVQILAVCTAELLLRPFDK